MILTLVGIGLAGLLLYELGTRAGSGLLGGEHPNTKLAAGKSYVVTTFVPSAAFQTAALLVGTELRKQGLTKWTSVSGKQAVYTKGGVKPVSGLHITVTGTYAGGQGQLVDSGGVTIVDVRLAPHPSAKLTPSHWYAVTVLVPSATAPSAVATAAAATSLKSQGFTGALSTTPKQMPATQAMGLASVWVVKCIGPYAGGQGELVSTQDALILDVEEVNPPAVLASKS
jgi:hypothetical protein